VRGSTAHLPLLVYLCYNNKRYLEGDEAVVAEVEALQVLETAQARHLRTDHAAAQRIVSNRARAE
jgi:hypothetical protein